MKFRKFISSFSVFAVLLALQLISTTESWAICITRRNCTSPPPPVIAQLLGRWESICLDVGDASIKTVYEFSEETLNYYHTEYVDTQCTQPFTTLNYVGKYKPAELQPNGARKLLFSQDSVTMLPGTQAAVSALTSNCPSETFEQGQAHEMSGVVCNGVTYAPVGTLYHDIYGFLNPPNLPPAIAFGDHLGPFAREINLPLPTDLNTDWIFYHE